MQMGGLKPALRNCLGGRCVSAVGDPRFLPNHVRLSPLACFDALNFKSLLSANDWNIANPIERLELLERASDISV
jgi:hypothetical protein